jgi:hypothetical protein
MEVSCQLQSRAELPESESESLLLSDSSGFVDVRCSLWWEDRSVIYNCCWPSPVQSFLGLNPMGLVTILQSQIRDFPFRRLLQLAGLRWRYSTPPPCGSAELPLYPWWNIPRFPLDRRLGGAQRWSGHCGVGKNLLPLQGFESWLSSL